MDNPREVITGCAALVGVAAKLNVPVIITEQYPKGLGTDLQTNRKDKENQPELFDEMQNFGLDGKPEMPHGNAHKQNKRNAQRHAAYLYLAEQHAQRNDKRV